MSRFSCGRLRGLGRPRLLESCRSLSRNLADHRVAARRLWTVKIARTMEATGASRKRNKRQQTEKRRNGRRGGGGGRSDTETSWRYHARVENRRKLAYPRGIQRSSRDILLLFPRANFKTRWSRRTRNPPRVQPRWSISTPIRPLLVSPPPPPSFYLRPRADEKLRVYKRLLRSRFFRVSLVRNEKP